MVNRPPPPWVLLIACLALAGLAAMCAMAWGAPAPLPRREGKPIDPHPPELCGPWVLQWSGCVYRATLDIDGAYSCGRESEQSPSWVGSWRWDNVTGRVA